MPPNPQNTSTTDREIGDLATEAGPPTTPAEARREHARTTQTDPEAIPESSRSTTRMPTISNAVLESPMKILMALLLSNLATMIATAIPRRDQELEVVRHTEQVEVTETEGGGEGGMATDTALPMTIADRTLTIQT